jgi:hypothetical protein
MGIKRGTLDEERNQQWRIFLREILPETGIKMPPNQGDWHQIAFHVALRYAPQLTAFRGRKPLSDHQKWLQQYELAEVAHIWHSTGCSIAEAVEKSSISDGKFRALRTRDKEIWKTLKSDPEWAELTASCKPKKG